jgi:hypothetical protein
MPPSFPTRKRLLQTYECVPTEPEEEELGEVDADKGGDEERDEL